MKVHASQSTNYIRQSFKNIVIFTLHCFWSGYAAKYLELHGPFTQEGFRIPCLE
jgi:hypothetical protein